jgi:AcrR family transcriptional regulator
VSAVKSRAKPSLRAERAAVTRTRIAEAARRLFSSAGYGATTLQAIADEAGVAVQTVYAVFDSKAGILRQLREDLMRQPAADARYTAALEAHDPGRKLELFAASIRHRWEGGRDVVKIHDQAAASDRELRREVAQVLGVRRAGIERLAASLRGHLSPPMTIKRVAAILDALTLPSVYEELVALHGWEPDAYEAWLAALLKHDLLGV